MKLKNREPKLFRARLFCGVALGIGVSFTQAGAGTFSDANWATLGSGMGGVSSPRVNALAVLGTNLYAGGGFWAAGGVGATNIAKWDGSNWSPMGSGMGGFQPVVHALAVSGSDLYAGGEFTTAGGMAANYIAKWDGSSWTNLGSGMGFWVNALAVSGNDLYAGGSFWTADGSPGNFIAKWNGSSWTSLGSGLAFGPYTASVNTLATSGSDVYVGGYFTTAGGVAA